MRPTLVFVSHVGDLGADLPDQAERDVQVAAGV